MSPGMSVTRAATPAASALVRAAALLTVAVGACHDTTTAPSRITPADTPSLDVNYSPTTGTGFVGKGDVQTVLAMNNAQLQKAAGSLVFTYVLTNTYEVVNAWASGNVDNPMSLNHHTATVTTTAVLNDVVTYLSRNNPKSDVTGFNLTGFGATTVTGTIPVPSPTVTYVTFSWDEHVWTGTWTQVACPTPKDPTKICNGVKIYTTVTHTTDQLPAYYDANGNLVLYLGGDNKAILSVTLLDSVGGLFVNGVALPITTTF